MSAPERHHATTEAWKWLEEGEGKQRTPEERERIAGILRELDRELHELDAKTWPEPKPLPADYWETAE
jgi:hypothetical protein